MRFLFHKRFIILLLFLGCFFGGAVGCLFFPGFYNGASIRHDSAVSACTVKTPGALPVIIDDERKFYVLGIIDGNSRDFSNYVSEGDMMIIVQDKDHECYAMVSPKPFASVPNDYVQVTTQAVILADDDSGERKMTAMMRRDGTVPHL